MKTNAELFMEAIEVYTFQRKLLNAAYRDSRMICPLTGREVVLVLNSDPEVKATYAVKKDIEI